jgi:ribosomal protein L7/L12
MNQGAALTLRKAAIWLPFSLSRQLPKRSIAYDSLIRYSNSSRARPIDRYPQQQLHRTYETSATLASPEAATSTVTANQPVDNAGNASTQQHTPFRYKKAEELFHRIVARCETIDDARALQRTVYELLGKPLREFEFYIDGFGGKRSKHSSGSGKQEEAAEPVKEVQKIFDVKLMGYDSSIKLKVIKEIRAILPGLGLKEAKELVESAPCTIQKGLQPEQAEVMKQKLSDVGAQIELV